MIRSNMNRAALIAGVIGVATIGSARADGPCTDDIAKLGRQLGNSAGLGAPLSEPVAGLAAGQKSGQAPGDTAASASDRAQPGGASRAGGGSPGTVGGAAGPVGAAAGSAKQDSVSSGQVATSAEDVRRQSEGKPTMAQQAAMNGGKTGAAASDTASEDKVSQAKMALQRAVDLNARGDQSCTTEIAKVRDLMPKS